MSRYAILSDVHANLVALQTVFRHIEQLKPAVDGIWCLGDLVVYGFQPLDTLRELRERGVLDNCVAGNNDYAIGQGLRADSALQQLLKVQGTAQAVADPTVRPRRITITTSHNWTWGQLNPPQEADDEIKREAGELLEALRALPDHRDFKEATLLHASPCEPVGMEGNYLREEADAEEAFVCAEQTHMRRLCFFGHTHLPAIFEQTDDSRPFDNVRLTVPGDGDVLEVNGNRILVNPGSVGQPRNRDPRAHYAVYDTQGSIRFHRVAYDFREFERALERSTRDAATGKEMKVREQIHAAIPEEAFDIKNAIVNTLVERFKTAEW